MVETIARFGQQDSSFKQAAIDIVSNTYDKSRNQLGATDWKNDFYDDEGWWAMGWIASYDLTGDAKYLNTAKDIFEDMTSGWTTPCSGGIWWDKKHTSIAAISNELFLSVGAHLANRVSAQEKEHYQNWAQMEWDWFWESGIVNGDSLVNDGIDQTSCKNDGKTTYTYNQGVVLSGLSELARAKSDGGLIAHANSIANAAMAKLSPGGILTEPVSGSLDEQGAQFKGAFVRGLATLNGNEGQASFADFLKKNAASAWSQGKVNGGVIVDRWQGGSSNANTASHAAGIDVLVAAAGAS
ncbi:Six-hairpin glycosidase [Setomelanomma holmii]|uniref:Six-hairpin glycosidase n=1 Tax=Setomelanomma holmii TaxID=210430 RepID=A0A9P4HLW9_9PLEO|nr:Six-hairpin glycosidase [Setomelanomma holmii]